jgi:TIR domain-containing protein
MEESMSGKPGASIQRGRRSSAAKCVTIFISYSRKDDQWATRIHEALENNNITVWRDKSRIRAGEKISDSISSAINLAN